MGEESRFPCRPLIFGAEDLGGNVQIFQFRKGFKETAVESVDDMVSKSAAVAHGAEDGFHSVPGKGIIGVVVFVAAEHDQNVSKEIAGEIQGLAHVFTKHDKEAPVKKPLRKPHQFAFGAGEFGIGFDSRISYSATF